MMTPKGSSREEGELNPIENHDHSMFTVLLTPAEADDEKEGDISNGRWGESYAFDPGMLHFFSTTIGVTPTPLKESLLTTPSKVMQ